MRDQRKAEEIAAQRVQLLSPLLADGLDSANARQIKVNICEQTGLSERTLRRYLANTVLLGLVVSSPKEKVNNSKLQTLLHPIYWSKPFYSGVKSQGVDHTDHSDPRVGRESGTWADQAKHPSGKTIPAGIQFTSYADVCRF